MCRFIHNLFIIRYTTDTSCKPNASCSCYINYIISLYLSSKRYPNGYLKIDVCLWKEYQRQTPRNNYWYNLNLDKLLPIEALLDGHMSFILYILINAISFAFKVSDCRLILYPSCSKRFFGTFDTEKTCIWFINANKC